MFKTLKGKISSVYLFLLIMIIAIGFVSAINLYRLGKVIDGLMVDNYKSINASNMMLGALERQDSAILMYLNNDKQKGMDMFAESNTSFLKWYNIEANNITEPGEKEYVERINDYYIKYLKEFSYLQDINLSSNPLKGIEFYNNDIYLTFTNIKNEIRLLIDLNEKAMFNSKARVTDSAEKYMYIVSLLSIAAAIIGFMISRFSIGMFLRPIYELTQRIRLVKAGDLDQCIDITSDDEVGELSKEFNNMTKRLQQFEKSTIGELMAEKNKSLTIVKNISDPLIVLNKNYKIILLNNACENFFDIQESKVLNRYLLEVIRNTELYDYVTNFLENDSLNVGQKIMSFKKHDKDYYFNIIVNTIQDQEEAITGIVILFQNVTQLKEMERIKADFIATISHEFKTPLTSIMMGASLMGEKNIGTLNAKQKKILDTICEDGERLTALVSNLLKLTKIESGKAIFNIRPCSVKAIVEESIKLFVDQFKSKNVKLYHTIEDNIPEVYADFEKMTWVVNNLISNALKYTPGNGTVKIDAFIKQDKVCISVSDTGIGIPKEYISKVFDKFIQIGNTKPDDAGTGLGLAISKEIVEANGGEIWAESKAAAGSIFTFTLPIDDRELSYEKSISS